MLNEFIKYIKFFFYYIFYCYNKKDSSKLKKSDTNINLINDNQDNINQDNINQEFETIFLINSIDYRESNIYICNICNHKINNNHYLVYDKHFCSFDCRKKYLIKY
jgi:hypothetical protein